MIHQLQGFLEALGLVDINGQHRAKDLLTHGGIAGVLYLKDRWFNKVALALVVPTAGYQLYAGIVFCIIDVAANLVEALFIDHRIDEIAEIFGWAHLKAFQVFLHIALYFFPEVGRDVGAGGCRALLPLVLKGAAADGSCQRFGIGRVVGHDKVLATGFAHDAGVALIAAYVFANGFPDGLEHAGAACKVDAGKIGMLKDHLTGRRAMHIHQVDYPIGHTSLAEHFHEHMGRVDLGFGRFPHHGIAQHGGGCGQVAGNGGKVKGGKGKHKTFQRAVLQAVPDAGGALGLHLVHLAHEVNVEAQKVDELTGRINLGLVGILGLAQHGGGIESGPVGAGNQLGSFQENAGAHFPAHAFPQLLGIQGGLYGLLHMLGIALVVIAQHMLMIMRGTHFFLFLCTHFFAAYVHGHIYLLAAKILQGLFKRLALSRAWSVVENGFVFGIGYFEKSV
ncbi:hypothetical protein ADICEAN_03899 [Cesiribacter andamanensis AMV16]|uniref:Uncharacterized protein n=1 Tax=Cesiribacter andamanensis AMV16 TaxID=1279009 RepID=M7N180_9BACT|nr:hypothetical protein ADICEAN_03899 [Cesiribacter andamanensis AMV16]